MSRHAIIVPIHPAAIGGLLALKDDSGCYVHHVEHDHARNRVLVHVRGPELPEVADETEAPVVGWLGESVNRSLRHPVGPFIGHLASLGNPQDQDAAGLIACIRELVGSDALACLGLVDPPQVITADTKSELLALAAHLVALAGLTLDVDEAADTIALEEALDPIVVADARVSDE